MKSGQEIGNRVFHYESLKSTNDSIIKSYLEGNVVSGNVILASFQENGRGQQQNTWESVKGENLLLSFILDGLRGLPGIVNKTFCLAVADTISRYIDADVYIKWPNDIIYQNAKIAGILIENSFRGREFLTSTIGIGININQQKFKSYSLPATSLSLITGRKYDLNTCFENLLEDLNFRYGQYLSQKYELIHAQYLSRLWGWAHEVSLRSNGEDFMGRVIDVDDYGSLLVKNDRNNVRTYINKEVSFVF